MFPTLITALKNHAYFLPGIVQFDWSISDQLQYSLKIYQFGCIALFYVFWSWTAQIRALNPLLVYFPFWHLENNKINERILTKATVGISREIWCSNRETGRLDEKLGDSQENWESWQVWSIWPSIKFTILSLRLIFTKKIEVH